MIDFSSILSTLVKIGSTIFGKKSDTPTPVVAPQFKPKEIIVGGIKKSKIMSIVNVFETGSTQGDYANISLYNDGKNDRKQITYGRSQVTQDGGNLQKLLEMYIKDGGKYADKFKPYISKMSDGNLYKDLIFLNYLKTAAKEDPIMISAQDKIFDTLYWNRAVDWFTENGFKENLSMLVIYDSFVHSGSILPLLRNRFNEVPPAKGGDEKAWITAYTKTRKSWLAGHSRRILQGTVYRPNCFLKCIDNNNWNLDQPVVANGITVP